MYFFQKYLSCLLSFVLGVAVATRGRSIVCVCVFLSSCDYCCGAWRIKWPSPMGVHVPLLFVFVCMPVCACVRACVCSLCCCGCLSQSRSSPVAGGPEH